MKIGMAPLALAVALACTSCGGDSTGSAPPTPTPTPTSTPTPSPTPTPTPTPKPITGVTQSSAIASFDTPWSFKILPDGRFIVTQRTDPGAMSIVTQSGAVTPITGLPTSIGMLDVVLAPDFATSHVVYFSYMVRDTSVPRVGRAKDDLTLFPERMTVARAKLVEAGGAFSLSDLTEVFRQEPAIVAFAGSGEPGGRIVFTPDNKFLLITSGDRQELDKTFLFSLSNNLGKIVRILPDGTIPSDNPFVSTPGARPEIWTLGHRNTYGLVFTPDSKLWSSEMGPLGGDELNLILPQRNYGWPAVSNGDNYGGSPITRHQAGDGYEAPKFSWTPVIAPAGMIHYGGDEFGPWKGDLILTGLKSKALVRVRTEGDTGAEVQRIDMGIRVRDIVEGPGGALWILSDGKSGQIVRISPVF